MCNLRESEEGIKATRNFNERLSEEMLKQKEKFYMTTHDMSWGGSPIHKPTYHQALAIGLKREEPQTKDEVFEQQHGYPYFLVNYQADGFIIEWDILSHELTVSVADVLIGQITLEKAREIIENVESPGEK